MELALEYGAPPAPKTSSGIKDKLDVEVDQVRALGDASGGARRQRAGARRPARASEWAHRWATAARAQLCLAPRPARGRKRGGRVRRSAWRASPSPAHVTGPTCGH